MSDTLRVFVNAEMIDLPAGATVADAIRTIDQSILEKIADGAAFVTDGRGIALRPSDPLASGAIIRLGIRASTRSADADP